MLVSNPIWRRRSFQIEMVLLLLIVAVAAWMSGSLVARNPNITGDGIQYTSVVFNWFQGNGYTNVPGIPWLVEPGYGFLTYLMNIFVRDIELAGMLVSSMAYLLLIILVYFTVRYLGGSLSALMAVLFVAFYPYLITFSWLNLTDSVFSFFVFLCFSVYVRILLENRNVLWGVLLGVLLGLTTLIRPEGYVIAFLSVGSLFCYQIWSVWGSKEKEKRKVEAFVPIVMTLLSFIMVVLPFILFIHQITGTWVLTPKSIYLSDNKQVAQDFQMEGAAVNLPSATDLNNPQAVPTVEITPNSGQVPQKNPATIPPLYAERFGNNLPIWLKYFEVMSVQVLFVLLIALAVYGFLKLGEVSVRNSRKEGKAKSFHHAKKPIKADETLFTSDPLFKFPPTTQRDRLILFALAVYFLPSFAYLFRLLMYRYLLPYMIYFLIFAALWLATIINKIRVKLALSSSIFIFVLVNISWFFSISQPGTTLLSNITSLANMSALPQVLQIEHVNLGVRAAGIWLSEHGDMQRNPYLGTSKNTQNGCQLILFQALGKKFPVRGRCSTAFNTEQIKSFAQDKGEYFILDNDSVKYFPQLASIWKNPSLMLPYGFKPYYQDFAGLFQIYINSH